MKIQDLTIKFPHLPEKIFKKLDNESLFKCREVARSWQNIIDGRNYPWLRIVSIPTILRSGIHLAAETGQIEVFKTALNMEEDKHISNECHETPFHLACEKGRFKIVQLLMENTALEIAVNAKNNLGIDLNAKSKHFNTKDTGGFTAFHYACQNGHSDVVKIFMENAATLSIDLNAKDSHGSPAFHQACREGHTDLVKIFMENACALGIDPNTPDEHGFTAFHCACVEGQSSVAKFFMENACAFSIDLNSKDDSGLTGFYYACSEGHSDLVKIFMENACALSIDLNSKDEDGYTAFQYASKYGESDVIKIFMENGFSEVGFL